MKKTVSLKENYLFRRAYSKGKSAADGRMVLYFRRNGGKKNRLGITVSTKLGCAVVRNRIRRRIREIYRLREDRLIGGIDLVVVARARAAESRYQQLEDSFVRLADKLAILQKAASEG